MAAFDLTGTASPRARLGALFKSGSNYSALRDELKASFTAGACSDVAFRKAQLRALVNCLTENVDEASAAIAADMGRPKGEAQGEVMATVREANDVIAKLDKWAKPERVSAHFMMQPSHAAIRRSPYGVVLVLGPYNYPLMLLLEPVIGAIAAGNVVVCKPSELTPATADFIARQLPKYVSAEVCRVVTGSADVSAALTATQWDFIYFTGSPRVGKLVAKAAAEYMTPHVLELGGKAPVVVHSSANLREAARRIINTKALNCGQTCVAPDYILVDASVHEQFLQLLKSQMAEQMGAEPSVSPDYGRMCTVGHFDRMEKLIKARAAHSAFRPTHHVPSCSPSPRPYGGS
jgi:aldehyde dehydrogenase (NAD+)